jgi:NAD(P)-dependent dehydrogenase (short-subunit alcohol dehydrogenase family)
MKATTQDLAHQNIRACCVCPGLVDTDLLRATMNAETINYMLNNKVIGKRLIEPREIAEVLHFCATSPIINDAIIDATLGFK